MKILLVGYTNSIHFWRWALFLKKAYQKVSILSFVKTNIKFEKIYENYLDYSVKGNKILKFIKLIIKILKSINFINKSGFDLINFNYFELYSAFIALFTKKKIMITCWGSDILKEYKKASGIKKIIFDITLNKASIITCDSESIKNLIIKKCKKIKKDKIHLIYWGINPDLFPISSKKEKNELRKKYNIPGNSIVLLSIRNLTEPYNIFKIIKYFKNKITDNNIILLVKIPLNSNKNYLKKCINEAGNNKNIIFLNNNVSHDKINEIYKISDISLHFPDSDSTPVSMLESISSGNLIICSNQIESYKLLNDYYDIKLIKLDDLDKEIIYKMLKDKNGIILKNKEKLKKLHTEKISVKKIKSLFKNQN